MKILRRKGVGLGLRKALREFGVFDQDPQQSLPRESDGLQENWSLRPTMPGSSTWLLRVGATKNSAGFALSRQMNTSAAIKRSAEKKSFRLALAEAGVSVPETKAHLSDVPSDCFFGNPKKMVVRPSRHSQGKNFHIAEDFTSLSEYCHLYDDYYISEFINKSKEYRVFICQGKVFAVAEKVPSDVTSPVWNVHDGGSVFRNVKWSNWPIPVCEQALEAHKLSGLDWSGVDVMVDQEGTPYVAEVNSAPSFPLREDGEVAYRTRCFIMCLNYVVEQGTKEPLETPEVTDYKSIIHPALVV